MGILESSTHEANQLSYPVWETYFHNKNEKTKKKNYNQMPLF